jgi:antitoxin VapB
MGLTITNEDVVRMIRELAERRGVSPDEAVRQAVEREVAQTPAAPVAASLRERSPEEAAELYEKLMAIARRAHARPVRNDLSEDEILGYDENGIPTR